MNIWIYVKLLCRLIMLFFSFSFCAREFIIMRTTELRCAQNIGAQFRALWLIQGRRRVADTGAEAILASKGIKALDPKEIFSPPYHKE